MVLPYCRMPSMSTPRVFSRTICVINGRIPTLCQTYPPPLPRSFSFSFPRPPPCFALSSPPRLPAPSSTTAPAAPTNAYLPVQGQMNPAQIALAAARNLGVHSALPSPAGAQALAGYQANPQLLAQLMRSPQAAQQTQCRIYTVFEYLLYFLRPFVRHGKGWID